MLNMVKIAGPAVLTLAVALGTAGHAGASPAVTGQTYGDASSALSNAGFKAVVAATFGDRMSRADCLVVSQRDVSIAQKGTHDTAGTTVALSLNCDNQQASVAKPGFSAASPEGRAAAAKAAAAAKPTA